MDNAYRIWSTKHIPNKIHNTQKGKAIGISHGEWIWKKATTQGNECQKLVRENSKQF